MSLRLENLMMTINDATDLTLMVTDYAIAKIFEPEAGLSQFLHSPIYMAPETFGSVHFEAASDIWAAGVIMHLLITGEPPFKAKSEAKLIRRIQRRAVPLTHPNWTYLTKPAREILAKMLTKEPAKRPSASNLLKHPWFNIVSPDCPDTLLLPGVIPKLQQWANRKAIL